MARYNTIEDIENELINASTTNPAHVRYSRKRTKINKNIDDFLNKPNLMRTTRAESNANQLRQEHNIAPCFVAIPGWKQL